MKKLMTLTALITYIAATSTLLFAQNKGETVLMKGAQEQEYELQLKGRGVKKYFLYRIFNVALYSNIPVTTEKIGEAPKYLEVKYFVSIPAEKIRAYTIKNIVNNATQSDLQEMQQSIEEMKPYFVDLNPGDTYSLFYNPGEGIEFSYNGKLIGSIANEILAKALFSIWIGEKPFDKNLRNQLLEASYAQLI